MRNGFLPQRPGLVAVVLILLLTILAYANSLKNGFVWDDYSVIVENAFVKAWRNVPMLFHRAYLTKISDLDYLGERDIGSGELTYRPVVTASYFVDYALWKLNPFGYHLSSLALHLANALLLYMLLRLVTRNPSIALLASLFFALHPVNTEAVDVVSFREDLLAFFFFVGASILFIHAQNQPPRKKMFLYLVSNASFLLALFSKEMAITLPLVLFVFDYFFISRQRLKSALSRVRACYAGYLVSLACYAAVKFFLIGDVSRPAVWPPMSSFYTRMLTMSKVFVTYLQWLLIPLNIHPTLPDDPAFVCRSLFSPGALASLMAVAVLCAAAIKMRKRFPLCVFGACWFAVTLIPVSNMVFPLANYIAARYLYLPGAGFCVFLAACLIELPDMRLRRVSQDALRKISRYAMVFILLGYAQFTFIQNIGWANNMIFWSNMAEQYPRSASAHSGLGEALRKAGIADEAIREYTVALSLDPGYAKDYNELGVCFYEKGMLKEAAQEFTKALQLDPGYATAYANLGGALGDQRFYQQAVACFEKAIQLDGRCIRAYNGLAVTYARMKKYDQARRLWEKILTLAPGNKRAAANLRKLSQLGY
ncbi:MAG TPA: tetratricopeptide repeat protein [Patescibacteria group bacterium]|nr:tetratricopeptide repeat protein [Patescibacteria group bacterium]